MTTISLNQVVEFINAKTSEVLNLVCIGSKTNFSDFSEEYYFSNQEMTFTYQMSNKDGLLYDENGNFVANYQF